MTSKVGVENSSYVLHDSIYHNKYDKYDDTGRVEGTDKKSTSLSFFKYLDDIDEFVSHRGDDFSCDELVCGSCSDQVSRMIERVYSCSQEQARSYAVAIHEYQTNYPHCELGVDQRELGVDQPPVQSKFNSPISCSQLDECGADLLEHIENIDSQRIEIRRKIEEELALIANMESEVMSLDEDISLSVSRSNTLGHEINFLNSEYGSLSVLFDLNISSASSLSSALSREGEGVFDGCIEKIRVTVNGMRLMYLPYPSENLNWAEINRAWSCLSLLVLCLRYKGKLEEAATIVIEANGHNSSSINDMQKLDDDFTNSTTHIRLKLQPLRRRTLILLSLEHHLVDEVNETIDEALCLHGEGSGSAFRDRTYSTGNDEVDDSDDPDKFYAQSLLTPEQYRRHEYYQAVIALAAVVWITARDLDREDCLTEAIRGIDLSPLLNPPSAISSTSDQSMEDLVSQLCYSVKNLMTT